MYFKTSNVVYVTLLILLLTVVTMACVEPVKAASKVDLLTNSGFIASTGSYYIVGEVQNTGDSPLEFVKITATYYDSSNAVIVTDYGYTELDVLVPNAKSPYTVMLIDKTQASKVDHYSLTVSFSETTAPQQALTILSHSKSVSQTGALHIIGEVKNNGNAKSTYTTIVATLYDSTGKVIGEDFTFTDPQDINAGATAPFDLLYVEYDRVPNVSSYSITVESDQYISSDAGAVPEYPATIALIAILIGTICLVMLSKSKFGKR